jgi:ribonuclease R
MVCEMFISSAGKVRESRFFPAVMRSQARLTYTEVNAMVVERKRKVRERYAPLVPHLEELYALYRALRTQRDKRGAIDFESTETRIVFGEDRKISSIEPVERNDAHRLIEEFMIAANVSAAEFVLAHEAHTLFRVHTGPGAEKLADLRAFLGELGLQLGGRERPEPKHYAALLNEIRERPDAHLIQTVLLRSLSQAVYSPDNVGHFGLAVGAYSHFTSPIRRYPDLLLHRVIRHVVEHGKGAPLRYSHEELVAFGEHCSMTERRADEATRDAMDWLKCEYMQDKVNEEFDGVISSVTAFGIFVQLKDVYVEGLVHVTSLQNDYYHFEQAKHRLVGERTRQIYRLGDGLRVRVMRVNLDERKIDFELAAPVAREATRRTRKRRR